MTPAAQTSEPRTAAGRRLIEMLPDYSFGAATNRWQEHLQKYVEQVLAIEAEAAALPANKPEPRVQAQPARLDAPLDRVLADLRNEVAKARAKHPPMHSPHEGHSVIREELDPELWEHVCADTGRSPEARHEALQVAAMGVRYILDLIDDPPAAAYAEGESND